MSRPASSINTAPVNYAQAARSANNTPSAPSPSAASALRAPPGTINGAPVAASGRTLSSNEAASLSKQSSSAQPSAINFGSLNDASSMLSSSPAAPSNIGTHLQPGGQLAFGSLPSTSASSVTTKVASETLPQEVSNGKTTDAGLMGNQPTPSAPQPSKKFDYNSFFQGGGGSTGSSAPTSGPPSEAPSTSSSAAPTPAMPSSALPPELQSRKASTYEASASSATSSPRPPSAALSPQTYAQQPAFAHHQGGLPGGGRPFSPAAGHYPANMVFVPQTPYGHQRTGSGQVAVPQPYQNGTPRTSYGAPPNTGLPRPGPQRFNSSQTPTSPRLPSSSLPAQAMPFQYAGYPPQYYMQNGQFPQYYPYGYPAAPSPYAVAQQHQHQQQAHQQQQQQQQAQQQQAPNQGQQPPTSSAASSVNGAATPVTQRASTASPAPSALSVSSAAAPSTAATPAPSASSGPRQSSTATDFSVSRDFKPAGTTSKAILIRKPPSKAIETKKPPTSAPPTAANAAASATATTKAAPVSIPVAESGEVIESATDLPAKQAAETSALEEERSAKEAKAAAEAEQERQAKQDAAAKEAAAAEAQRRADEAEADRLEQLRLADEAAKATAHRAEVEKAEAEKAKAEHQAEEAETGQKSGNEVNDDEAGLKGAAVAANASGRVDDAQSDTKASGLIDASAPQPEPVDMPALVTADAMGDLDPESAPISSLNATQKLSVDGSRPSSASPSRPSTPPAPPHLEIPEKRSGPLPLSTARPVQSLSEITYPEGIAPPRAELNVSAPAGHFRYDRDFLLQFMEICRDRPDGMPDAESLGMTDTAEGYTPSTPRSGSRSYGGARSATMPPPPARQASMGMPARGMQAMGAFGAGPAKSSADRFQQATAQMVMGGFGGGGFGGKGGLGGRTPSQQVGSRSGSKRGNQRNASHAGGARGSAAASMQYGPDGQPVAPLAKTENAWSDNINKGKTKTDETSPEMVQRKVKALLNKLTVDNFGSISKQILIWADKSKDETDGRILRQVIQLIFEKATDEASWSTMYARLCRMLQDTVSENVRDLSLKDAKGNPVGGGTLFRKYLLNRCQEDYERGWANRDELTAAAKSKAGEDEAKKAANEQAKAAAEESGKVEQKEAELLSDEYYAAQKAKRQGLGLVKFIGELFKLTMLTARIMHDCVRKLLRDTENPEEEDVESLCRLLTTVGHMLDGQTNDRNDPNAQKSAQVMKIYFERLETLRRNEKLSSRIRFMIQDLQEIKANGWQGRTESAGPKTISEIHADAARATAEEARRVASGGRGMPRMAETPVARGNSRSGSARTGLDGWSTVPATAPPARPSKAGDLKAFGQVRTPSATGGAPTTFGPSGAFAIKGRAASKETPSPAETPRANAFAALENAEAPEAESSSARPRLNLAPRTLPLEGDGDEAKDDEAETEDAAVPEQPVLDDAAIKRSIDNSIKEFFELKDYDEAVLACQQLPDPSKADFVAGLSIKVIDMREEAVNQLCDLFDRFLDEEVMSSAEMGEGFKPLLKDLDDLGADAPKAFQHAARLLRTTDLEEEDVVRLTEGMESIEGDDDEARQEVRDRLLEEWRKRAPAES